jgi:ribonuclease HI
MTKAKQPVENQDLWEAISQLLDTRTGKISWTHVRGHDGIPGNDRADLIATSFADEKPIELYCGTRKAYTVDLEKTIGNGTRQHPPSRSGKPYSYVSRVHGSIETHQSWGECEKRVKGKAGAKFKKVFSKEEETALIREWSEGTEKHRFSH